MVAAQMYEQLSRMSTIKSAIVAGRLEDVREPAAWLIEHKTVAGFPVEFESYVAQMRSYARQVIEAQDLGAAAESVSKIAESCGNCHLVTDINLAFGYVR